MAWLAVAEDNNELVNRLIELRIIKSKSFEIAFRLTDRGSFIGEKS